MNDKLILIGGGGHCKSCIDVIEQKRIHTITGILDQTASVGGTVLGYNIIGTDEDIAGLAAGHHFLITVGQIKSPEIRMTIYRKILEAGGYLASVISPRAYVSPHALVGPGTIVMHGATINAGAEVGTNCIINSHALVEHDAVIGDHCHIATGAIINGGAVVGRGCFVGSHAMLREYIHVNDNLIIGGGETILHDRLAPEPSGRPRK